MITKWIEKTIIGLELCPFTKGPYFEGKVLFSRIDSTEEQTAFKDFLTALDSFQEQSQFQTTLFLFTDWKISFKNFYEFSQDCEDQLENLGLKAEFQIVCFHPDFCFEGLRYSDRANLVNSSPMPLIHILKRIDLDLLNLSIAEAEVMSFNNSRKLELLNDNEIKDHFPWRLQSL